MENRKWLKRKYPETFNDVNEFLDDKQLDYFRKYKLKLARIVKHADIYPVGTLILFKRSNPMTDYNYPMHYAIVKCAVGFTASGYHSIVVHNQDFQEIVS